MNLFSTTISNSGMITLGTGNQLLLLVIKYMFIIGGSIYLLVAYLITRQVSIMSQTISTTASSKNKIASYVHFVFSLLALIYFFLVL